MKAIVLAGGLGTRLRPLTFAIPKALIPVGDRPILDILIENLKSHGVEDIVSTHMYIVGLDAAKVEIFGGAMAQALDGKPFPPNASTMIGVQSLAAEGMLVEISAVAMVA